MSSHPFDLSGKVALVTGANAGIGLGYADAIARAGGDVVIWGRREDRNAEAAERLAAHGTRVLADSVDVIDEAAQVAGFERAIAELGRLDCVIANAGYAGVTPIVDMTTDEYTAFNDVAQKGAFITLREGARHMVARAEAGDPGGSLIATGSLTNFEATPGTGHYAAAKGAVAGLIKTLAVELGRHEVRANLVCAGLIATDMMAPVIEIMEKRMQQSNPIARMGQPADLGGIVVYLMSDASTYHTGDIITIDGGTRANGAR
jgi:NAD(P)-dependent dehydrogenase (short-subunit alcohol dehydrogenase family)